MKRPEQNLQIACVRWFRYQYPDEILIHIPNGGYRRPSEAARLKAMGVVPGIPDLFIPEWRLFIEMKRTKGGKLSDVQKSVIEYLQSVNYCVLLAHGSDEAIKQIKENYERHIRNNQD